MKNRDRKRYLQRARAARPRRKKYTLSELIGQASSQHVPLSKADLEWLNMPSVGREIIDD